jgi:hypothetical protein
VGFDFSTTLKTGDMVALRRKMSPLYEESDYGIVLELRDISLVDEEDWYLIHWLGSNDEETWPASKLRLIRRAIRNSGDWDDKLEKNKIF